MILEILILGGTAFLGPHLVEECLQRGHEVTVFNRGLHNPKPFPGVAILDWHDPSRKLQAGLTKEKEKELLNGYKNL